MKATLLKTAFELAIGELEAGRNVMVLVPDMSWTDGTFLTTSPSDSRGALHIRCTSHHSGLKAVAIDTLILVEPTADTWDAAGGALARERLRTSPHPRVIKVGEKP